MKGLRMAVAWALVAVPLAWGVAQSVRKSVPLFREAPAAAAPVPVSTPTQNPHSP